MKIELRNKIDNENILIFNCNMDDIKITNENYNYFIEFRITEEQYDLLKSLNYSIIWHSPLIICDGNISDEILHEMSFNNRKYYIHIPLSELTDEQIYEFYSDVLGYTGIDLEFETIKCKDEYFKTKNLNIYIDNMLLDIDKSIFNDELTYV